MVFIRDEDRLSSSSSEEVTYGYPDLLVTRKDLGLPLSSFVFACTTKYFKIRPELFKV